QAREAAEPEHPALGAPGRRARAGDPRHHRLDGVVQSAFADWLTARLPCPNTGELLRLLPRLLGSHGGGRRVPTPLTIDEFIQKLEPGPNGCLLWTGYIARSGYGQFYK